MAVSSLVRLQCGKWNGYNAVVMKNEVMSQLLVGCIQCKMSHFCAQQLTLLRNPHIEQTNNTQLIE